mmetsp:Transcript_24618/g.52443  ORF Transcript_24618/g.52443 Transcript_24618/m.52443 type:complete len:231 (+) Transcript_24618:527-1219(+)
MVLGGKHPRLYQQVVPNLLATVYGQIVIGQGQGDSGLKGGVQGIHPIGGQKQDSGEILHQLEHNGNHRVPFERRGRGTFLQKRIRLVQQYDSVPLGGQFQYFRQTTFQVVRSGSERPHAEGIQRTLQYFRYGFGREGLPDAGWTVQQKHAAFSLALDQVLEVVLCGSRSVVVAVSGVLHESLDQPFPVVGQYEAIKDVFRKGNILQSIDQAISPGLGRERKANHTGPNHF